jgi:hypothetical protein
MNNDSRLTGSQETTIMLGLSGCCARLDEEGIIHVCAQDGQQLYALSQLQIPFDKEPLMLTLNLWFMAFNSGRQSMQREIKAKAAELFKLCF